MRQYVRGSTMLAKMDVRSNGALGDPGSTKCTIIDPLGTKQVNSASMSKTATGKYEYAHTIPTTAVLGVWFVSVIAVVGTRNTADFDWFEVING